MDKGRLTGREEEKKEEGEEGSEGQGKIPTIESRNNRVKWERE